MMEEHVTSLRSGRSTAKAIVGCLALSLIPAACALAAASSRVSSGPGWFTPNYDVEYPYLLNALRLQQRLPIVFFIHPATTLAVLYALSFAFLTLSHRLAVQTWSRMSGAIPKPILVAFTPVWSCCSFPLPSRRAFWCGGGPGVYRRALRFKRD